MKSRDLQRVVDFWAPRLGLGSWFIRISVVPRLEMPRLVGIESANVLGLCRPDRESSVARVWIALPREWPTGPDERHLESWESVESTLLHELVHASLYASGVELEAQTEEAVNNITRALLGFHQAMPVRTNQNKLEPLTIERDPCCDPLWTEIEQ